MGSGDEKKKNIIYVIRVMLFFHFLLNVEKWLRKKVPTDVQTIGVIEYSKIIKSLQTLQIFANIT